LKSAGILNALSASPTVVNIFQQGNIFDSPAVQKTMKELQAKIGNYVDKIEIDPKAGFVTYSTYKECGWDHFLG
jgi:hypothetical protein